MEGVYFHKRMNINLRFLTNLETGKTEYLNQI